MNTLKFHNDFVGSLLCDKLGYEPINISLSGSANSGIARSIVRWLDQFYKADEMEVFACIGWTESSRLEIPSMCDYRQSNLAVPWFDDSANSFWRINFGLESKNQDEQEIFATYQRFMAENPLILENWSASNVLMIQYLLNSLKIFTTAKMNRKQFLHLSSLGLASLKLPSISKSIQKPIVISTWDSGMPVNEIGRAHV